MTREEAIAYLEDPFPLSNSLSIEHRLGLYDKALRMAIEALKAQSAQPEPHYDEWCTDCKEYNHERHCCPRWNRVIRETLKDAQPNTDHIYAELSKVYNVKGLPDEAIGIIGDLMLTLDGPSAQPALDRTKISDLLEKIYSIQSAHLSVEGVLARKYYCEQVWIELFGSEAELPAWLR